MAIAINFNPLKNEKGEPVVLEGRYDGKVIVFPYREQVEFPDDAKIHLLDSDPEGAGLGRMGLVGLDYGDDVKKKELEALKNLEVFIEEALLPREESYIVDTKRNQQVDLGETKRKKKFKADLKAVKARIKNLQEDK